MEKYFESKWEEVRQGCPFTNCIFTDDRSQVDNADVVSFHNRDINLWNLPKNRKPHQKYVFLIFEPPTMTYSDLKAQANFYNWTMTYRRDSDIWWPYAHFVRANTMVKEEELSRNLAAIVAKKTRSVAWVVSNCNSYSKREKYVEQLAKYIDVDIYGKCGDLDCRSGACFDKLESYYFFLSFENAVCTDYVTEKLFNRMQNVVVPIVLRESTYTGIAPEGSFIAADLFPSAKELAKYLKSLQDELIEYMSYFQWRKHFKIYRDYKGHPSTGLCRLCIMLNVPERIRYSSYEDLFGWWMKGRCIADFGELMSEKS